MFESADDMDIRRLVDNSLGVDWKNETETETGSVGALRDKAENLLMICDKELSHVLGIKKMRRKIVAEFVFLSKMMCSIGPDAELKCSNLPHQEGVVQFLRNAMKPVETLRTFKTPACSDDPKTSLQVDVVTCNGAQWWKFVARNAEALVNDWKGRGEFKRRSLIDQVEDYVTMAAHHPYRYKKPRICFSFIYGIERNMAEYLQSRGITVLGERLEMDDVMDEHVVDGIVECESEFAVNDVGKMDDIAETSVSDRVNLDITAGIALISELCHGGCNFKFVDAVLTEQAEQERSNPVMPKLNRYLKDKTIVMCRTAYRELNKIVQTIGGSKERRRWDELQRRLSVVDDFVSRRTEKLQCRGKIRQRSLAIFGTGDALSATTVTANSGFVRAASGQGVSFTVFIHEARALTELKEATCNFV